MTMTTQYPKQEPTKSNAAAIPAATAMIRSVPAHLKHEDLLQDGQIVWDTPSLNQPRFDADKEASKPKMVVKTVSQDLQMPEAAMYGALGELARHLDAPFTTGYTSLLAIYAGMHADIVGDSAIRPTIYATLMGAPGVSKSIVLRQAKKQLAPDPENFETSVPASDRGLQQMCVLQSDKPPGHTPRPLVMIIDEFRTLTSKINISNSALASTLCSLWSEDVVGTADKTGHQKAHVRLSLIGALKVNDAADFKTVFGSATTDGLYDRFIFVPCPADYEPDHTWTPLARDHELILRLACPSIPSIKKEDFDTLSTWQKSVPALKGHRRRIQEIGLRVALISAMANGDSHLTPECLAAAVAFAEWQSKVRLWFSAGEALNLDARITDAILDEMSRHCHPDGSPAPVKLMEVTRNKNWGRKYGSTNVTRTRKALIEDGSIVAVFENAAGGATPHQAGLYLLASSSSEVTP
jgi:hypothetical protein